MTSSPVPNRIQRPRWTDPRVLLGVALVLASVVLGAKVVSSAQSTAPIWAATHDLAAGTVLTAGDVSVIQAKLGESAATYVAADQHIAGQVLTRQIHRGELLPVASVAAPDQTTTVTVPLADGAAPKLSRGQRIQLWLSSASCPAVLVLNDVVVQDSQTSANGLGSAGGQYAVVKVQAADAERVVTALGLPDAKLRATVLNGPGSATGLPASPQADAGAAVSTDRAGGSAAPRSDLIKCGGGAS